MRISIETLSQWLVSANIVQEDAVTDPDGYDGGSTMWGIAAVAAKLNEELGRQEMLAGVPGVGSGLG